MKNKTPNDDLLEALMLDAPAREASLRVVRRAARRRRWSRQARTSAVAAVVLAAGLMLFQHRSTDEEHSGPRPVGEAPYVVHSRALPEGLVVRTQEKSVAVVTTFRTGVEFFGTVNTRPPERIDDEMLLQLAPGAVLVRHQAGFPELIFPNHPVPEIESQAPHE